MDSFITIRIKRKVAKRFQQFSKTHYRTHSETIDGMLDFFYYNEISPKEKFGPTGRTIENNLKKRINAAIAIIKNIEKYKANPTLAILESLMEVADPKNHVEKSNYELDDTHPDFYK